MGPIKAYKSIETMHIKHKCQINGEYIRRWTNVNLDKNRK